MRVERFYPDEYKRGDSVTVTDGDTITTILYDDNGDADPDVFGDGGAYSIIDYPTDIGALPNDFGLLSGYESPKDVADDLLSDKLWVVANDACDCATTADLAYWLSSAYDKDLSLIVMAVRELAKMSD